MNQPFTKLLDRFDVFLDAVRDALPDSSHHNAKPGAKVVRELATALAVSDEQAREWFVSRRFVPSGPIAFKALSWLISRTPNRGADYVKAPLAMLRKRSVTKAIDGLATSKPLRKTLKKS